MKSLQMASMKQVQILVLLVAFFGLMAFTHALPRQSKTISCDSSPQNEEDCLDAIMHPSFAPETKQGRFMNSEDTNNYWLQKGKEALRDRVASKRKLKVAKNIILFVGDGMGLTTIAAARNLIGGEEQQLGFENFESVGLSKTYAIDQIVADSASTATAYLCGIKANYGTIGVNGQVSYEDCNAALDTSNYVDSIAKWALEAGKSAGLVTTTRVTHASPAGLYAHAASRHWENDGKVEDSCGEDSGIPDIALQLMEGEVGSKLKVILGGGRAQFRTKCGKRKDGRDLIAEYQAKSSKNAYVENLDELKKVDAKKTNRLLGLFQDDHMDYHLDADRSQPLLEQMTEKAIEFMQQTAKNGYFLFIEGGRIDSGHHGTKPRIALDETVEFSDAVALARRMTDEDDTLIVVTADHSHSFSLAGYQARGSDIFSVAPVLAEDEKSYLALSYANGPAFDKYFNTDKNARRKPENVLTDSNHAAFPATVPLDSESHSGEDVPVYASGPWSHLFTGTYEQNVIPHLMAYASCIGEGELACARA